MTRGRIWCRIAGRTQTVVDMRLLRQRLGRKQPPAELCHAELGLHGPIVGTIHASKGREADTVHLMLSDTHGRDIDQDEEARVVFVGATRGTLAAADRPRVSAVRQPGRGSDGPRHQSRALPRSNLDADLEQRQPFDPLATFVFIGLGLVQQGDGGERAARPRCSAQMQLHAGRRSERFQIDEWRSIFERDAVHRDVIRVALPFRPSSRAAAAVFRFPVLRPDPDSAAAVTGS